jgi:hypothetical protein
MSVVFDHKKELKDEEFDLSGKARLEALSARFGQDIGDLDMQQSLDLLAKAEFLSPADRACFWARDGSSIPDPRTGELKPLNEVIVELFMREENSKILNGAQATEGHPDLYLSMHDLPEGRALSRVIQPGAERPDRVYFEGWAYRNDSYAATDALIDIVAATFSKKASGIVTVSVADAESDSFFPQGEEFRNIIENPNVTGVRVLDLDANKDINIDTAANRGDELEERGLESSFFQRRQLALTRTLFTDKSEWEQWQRNQWLQTALRAVRAHNLGNKDFGTFRFSDLAHETHLSSSTYCQARFQCELYNVVSELQNYESHLSRTPENQRRFQAELGRLHQCIALIAETPELLKPVKDSEHTEILNRIAMKRTIFDIEERDRLLASFHCDKQASFQYSQNILSHISQQIDRIKDRA